MHSSHAVDRAVAASPALRAGARVLVAVSGGPDSMALLAAAAARVPSGVRIVAAHFDHRIRPESGRDIETVRAFADARGIPVIAGAGDVPARAIELRVSIETAARDARYEFLRATAARERAHCIATAHTRSDHVETVLMRVLRGAGERGLAGIAREMNGAVRPLLDVTRADTLDYCARRGIAFVVDPSNEDRRHARNAVRHDVLPALRRAFPGLDDALLRTSRRAEEALDAARKVTDTRLSALRREDDAWVLPVDAFAGLNGSEAAILLGDVMERVGCLEDVTAVHYGHLRALARDERVGASASLPGASVRRDHDALVWRVRGAESREEPRAVRLRVPGEIELNGWIVRASSHAGGSRLAAGCRLTGPVWPLTVRTPRPGDRIQPFGMNGTRKLSDVFIDRKVPHRDRARMIVVEAGGEILWVPGVVAAEATRVRDDDAPAILLTADREAS